MNKQLIASELLKVAKLLTAGGEATVDFMKIDMVSLGKKFAEVVENTMTTKDYLPDSDGVKVSLNQVSGTVTSPDGIDLHLVFDLNTAADKLLVGFNFSNDMLKIRNPYREMTFDFTTPIINIAKYVSLDLVGKMNQHPGIKKLLSGRKDFVWTGK